MSLADSPLFMSAAAKSLPPPVDALALALHSLILILAIFGLFALFSLPRLLTRFSRPSEWSTGYFLRYTPLSVGHKAWKRQHVLSPYSAEEKAAVSDDSFTFYAHSQTLHSHSNLISHKDEKLRPLSLPPHMASWSGRFHRLSAFLGNSFFPGYSYGRSIIILGYLSIVFYVALYKSNPFTDPKRVGIVAMSQAPIVFALGTKNNILGMTLALGYEKLNWLHRMVGRIVAVAANVHFLGYLYKWALAGTFYINISSRDNALGLVSLIGLNLIFLFSTSFFRNKAYNFFLYSHILGFIMFPVALAFHAPASIPWVLAAAGVYALDHVMRLFKTRICKATLRAIPELGITWVDIPRLNTGWRAGQHVRIRVVTSGMGILGAAEIHPFSIANVGGDGMTLMCKKTGAWTNSLYDLAARGESAYSGAESGLARTARIIVEGPYGGPGHSMFDSYSGAMFVAGGSGITFAISAVQDLVQKDVTGRSRIKVIELVWTIQDAGGLKPLLPTFTSLIQQVSFARIHISVYYTRSSMKILDPNKVYNYLPPNISISPGRPRLSNLLDSVVDRSCALFSPSGAEGRVTDKLTGVVVGVCGPGGLADDVRKAVGGVDPRRCKAVGGVELCEEVFGW